MRGNRDPGGGTRPLGPQVPWGLSAGILCVWAVMHSLGVAAEEVTVHDLIQTREISNPTVSPDGRYIAFLVEAMNVKANLTRLTWEVERLTPKPGRARAVADGGVPIRESFGPLVSVPAVWSLNSRWIYFTARRYGQVQVWRAARQGGKVQQVTRDSADVKSFALSSDGRRLYYAVAATRKAIRGEERREYEGGVLLTPTLEVYEPVLYNQLNGDRTRTTQRRGTIGTDTFELLDKKPYRVRVMRFGEPAHDATAADGAKYRKIAASSESEWYRLTYGRYFEQGREYLAATRGSATVFWRRQGTAGNVPTRQKIMSYRLILKRGGSELQCDSPACREYIGNFGAPQWRPGSDEVVWASQSELGATTLYAWNVNKNTVRTIFSSNAELGGTAGVERFVLMGCPVIASAAICVTSATEAPPELEEVNLDQGSQQVIFDPNRALRRAIESQGLQGKPLRWKDRYGKQHAGVLILPHRWKGDARWPLVLAGYHCRGFLEGSAGRMVSPFVLAEAGFAVLCSDMDFGLAARGGYPRSYFSAGGQLVNLQIMLDSWESGVAALNRLGVIDESRIGVAGLSFGAESVWYALTHSTFISAAVVQDPPWMDPFNYFMYGTAIFNQFADRGMPDPTSPSAAAFYAKASVALNANKITAPILEQDNEAEFISGMETYTELNRLKKPYEVYIFPDEFHEWVQPRHVMMIQKRTTDWYRFWLEGYEDPAFSKRHQYQRWKELCRMQRQGQLSHISACVRAGGGGG